MKQILLIPKTENYILTKIQQAKWLYTIIPIHVDVKILNKVFVKWIQTYNKKNIHHDKVGFIVEVQG